MPIKIVLLEDEEFISFLYKRQLELAGYTVDIYANGKTGLDAIKQNQYDVILLDIMLPDLNGLEILRQVKQADNTKNTIVLMLTNLSNDDIVKKGIDFGADGFLIKASLTPDQVVEEVQNVLNKKNGVLQSAQNQNASS